MYYHLAQINVARLRAPMDSPLLADFVAQVDPVNAIADQAPGFVWRWVGNSKDATELLNMSAGRRSTIGSHTPIGQITSKCSATG